MSDLITWLWSLLQSWGEWFFWSCWGWLLSVLSAMADLLISCLPQGLAVDWSAVTEPLQQLNNFVPVYEVMLLMAAYAVFIVGWFLFKFLAYCIP